MSSDSDSDAFLEVFAGKRGGARKGPVSKAAAVAAAEASAAAGAGEEETLRLRPPERKIASALRQHRRAVKTIVKKNNLARELAMGGIEAMEQAQTPTSTPTAAAGADDEDPPVEPSTAARAPASSAAAAA